MIDKTEEIRGLLEKLKLRERADDIWAFQKEGNLSYDQRESIKTFSCLLCDASKAVEELFSLLPPKCDKEIIGKTCRGEVLCRPACSDKDEIEEIRKRLERCKDIAETFEQDQDDPVSVVCNGEALQGLLLESLIHLTALAKQVKGLEENYALLEECSPPDWPRKDFVKHLFLLWENGAAEDLQAKIATLEEQLKIAIKYIKNPGRRTLEGKLKDIETGHY